MKNTHYVVGFSVVENEGELSVGVVLVSVAILSKSQRDNATRLTTTAP